MLREDIFILLGSNEGKPALNLAHARQNIDKAAGNIVRQSSLYRSAAWGMEQQADFCNQVLWISTDLSPENLLQTLLAIEQQMGRVRQQRWGPRIIDIDLLLYGNRIIETDSLKVPHPGIPHRRFTLTPLAEIAGDTVHPVLKQSIHAMLKSCDDPLSVEIVRDEW